MTVNDVYEWLDGFAPFETQDEYDNAGFIVGDPSAQVHTILFALDATKAAVEEAAVIGADLIATHHPLMFHPIQRIRYDKSEGTVLKALAVSGISLIAAHTNLDQCKGGVADSLAKALALQDIRPNADSPYLRTGTLQAPLKAREFLAVINRELHSGARLYGDPDAVIHSVAVVPGAGGDDAAHAEADAFVTGEIKHHELLAATGRGLIVFDAGHYPTEFPGVAALHKRFVKDAAKNGWAVKAALFTRSPYTYTV